MATEIRFKGPIVGQTILYTSGGGAVSAAQVTKINADGTINVLVFIDQQATLTVATSVPYDFTSAKQPSWAYSDDL